MKPEICVISEYFTKSYEMSPKQIPKNSFSHSSGIKSQVEQIEEQVIDTLDAVQLKINGMNVGILELMNYYRFGSNWDEQHSSQLYSYLNGLPLNGVYIEQFLIKNGFPTVSLENFATDQEILKSYILNGCKFIAISTSHFTQEFQVLDIAKFVKSIDPSCIVIAGGALIRTIVEPENVLWSLKIKEVLQRAAGLVDYYIVEKHGELTLLKLLKFLKEGKQTSPDTIENLIYFSDNGEIVHTTTNPETRPINEITYDYSKVSNIGCKRYLCVLTTRGCPFRCKFCTYHHLHKELEQKSIEVLRNELDSIPQDGKPRHIRFADDNFAVNKRRLFDFCTMMIEQKYNFTWSCMSSPHSLTDENAKIMADSGCKIVFLGIESANDEVLKNMNKGSRSADYYKAIETLKKNGIETIGSFIIGFPGETDASIEDNIRLINDSGMDYFQLNLWVLMPNQPVFRERHQHGLRGFIYGWQHKTMNAVQASRAMIHIMENTKGALTNTFGLSNSVQATIEYLYSLGFTSKEIRSLFVCYTKIVKDQINHLKNKPFLYDKEQLLLEFKDSFLRSLERIEGRINSLIPIQ